MSERRLPDNGVVTYTATVIRDWLDYNGHMNVAYYVMTFDLAVDAFKEVIGVSPGYIEREGLSTVALESHIVYLREASLGDELRVDTRVIDFDGKRAHLCQEMFRGDQAIAGQEVLAISFDTATRKSCKFDAAIAERYEWMVDAQSKLHLPAWVGGRVGIRRG